MKNKVTILKKTAILLLTVLLIIASFSGCGSQKEFTYWADDSSSLAELTDYVESVTEKNSKDFIPQEDRIAVFDMDGTLMGETAPTYFDWVTYAYRVLDDPDYAGQATPEMIKTAEAIRAIPSDGIPDWLEAAHIRDNAKAFEGMTLEKFEKYIRDFLEKDAVGFDNLTYAGLFYKPMVEVVNYLQENGFTVFIVSGTDTQVCRILLQNVFDIPSYQVIGSEYGLKLDGQPDNNGLEYSMAKNDTVIRDGTYSLKNVKANKVKTIYERIGRRPVLSFGNSSGDFSMAMITTSYNKYKSKAFFIIADDDVREYGSAEKASGTKEKVIENGWSAFSMKNDWKTIYGDEVVKTSR